MLTHRLSQTFKPCNLCPEATNFSAAPKWDREPVNANAKQITTACSRQEYMEAKIVPYEAVLKIVGHRVLVIAPHPDDEVFGCGGAIMRHADAGDVLQIVIVTNGEYLADFAQQLAHSEMRQTESRRAAAMMGCSIPIFWGMPDRGLEYGELLVERIAQAIGALEADLVYAPSVFEMHPDHRAIGMAALEAVRRSPAKPQLAMYEVGIPMPRINTLLDISDLTDRKQRAMMCFGSQLSEQAYDKHITALNEYRTYTLGKHVSAAEAYFLASADAVSTDFLGVFASEHERQRRLGLAIVSEDVPLVSVLIRNLGRPLLDEALDSVALQTYSHIEVVVVNAQASAHRKLSDICGRFPMRVVNTVEAISLSQAANIALDNAKGDFLIFLDDDDWLAPDHIANLVSSILVHADRKVAYAGVELRGEDRQPLDLKPFNEPFSAGRLRGDDYIPLLSVLFSQKLSGNNVRFDERLDAYEDWDFLLQLSALTKFVHVDRVSAYVRTMGAPGANDTGSDTTNRSAKDQIFTKWKAIWSGGQIDELVNAKTNTAQQRIHHLNIQLDQRNTRIFDQENALSTMGKKVDEVGATVTELRAQLREKDQSLCASEARIQEVFASTSWKFSYPIRWVGRLARYAKRNWMGRSSTDI